MSNNPLINLDLSSIQTLLDEPISEPMASSEILSKDPLRNDILTFIDSFFWLNAKLPSHTEIKERFNLSQDKLEIYLEGIAEPIKDRLGIDINPPVRIEFPQPKLDPLFIMAANEILNVSDKKTTAAKLKALGLTTRQWQALLRIKEHRDYFETRLEEVFGTVTDINKRLALAKNIEAGDLPSIRYYDEFTGKFRPQSGIEGNLVIILGRLMEILAKFLTPDQLSLVADELDEVLEVKELSA